LGGKFYDECHFSGGCKQLLFVFGQFYDVPKTTQSSSLCMYEEDLLPKFVYKQDMILKKIKI
jgi:hypothetical protein